MAIVVTCTCGKRLAAKEEAAGKRVRCPACQQPVLIPAVAVAVGAPIVAQPAAARHIVPQSVVASSAPSQSVNSTPAPAVLPEQVMSEPSPRAAANVEPATTAIPQAKPSPRSSKSSRLARSLALVATAASAIVLVLGLVAMLKPTWIVAPREITTPVVDGAQSVITRRLATVDGYWLLQHRRTTLQVQSGYLEPGAGAVPLHFAAPGSFVTDPTARRTTFPGFAYAYSGLSDGGSLILDSRTEVQLAIAWIGVFALLPAAWLARFLLRRKSSRVTS